MGILSIQTSTSASLCQGNSEAIRINQDPAFTAGALITPIWLIDCQLYHVVHSGSLRFLAFEFVFPANSFPENMDFPWPSWFSGGSRGTELAHPQDRWSFRTAPTILISSQARVWYVLVGSQWIMVESLGSTLDHLFPTHVGHNLASMLYMSLSTLRGFDIALLEEDEHSS